MLKPCPFCKAKDDDIDTVYSGQRAYVICEACHACGPECGGLGMSMQRKVDEAQRLWNERGPDHG